VPLPYVVVPRGRERKTHTNEKKRQRKTTLTAFGLSCLLKVYLRRERGKESSVCSPLPPQTRCAKARRTLARGPTETTSSHRTPLNTAKKTTKQSHKKTIRRKPVNQANPCPYSPISPHRKDRVSSDLFPTCQEKGSRRHFTRRTLMPNFVINHSFRRPSLHQRGARIINSKKSKHLKDHLERSKHPANRQRSRGTDNK